MNEILETSCLILRAWTLEDATKLFEICSDAEAMKYIGTGKPYKTIEQTDDFLHWAIKYQRGNGFCRWAVLKKETEEIVRSCGFARPNRTEEIERGYLLARKFWSKSSATEAATACLKYGFEKLKFKKVIVMTDLENVASKRFWSKSVL